MSDKVKNIILPIELGLIIIIFLVAFVAGGKKDYSESERRVLSTFPEGSLENVLSTKFMSEFETYSLDHFPGRDYLRTVKALSSYNLFLKKDNNRLYVANGHIAKSDYPIDYESLKHAVSCFDYINETFLADNNITPYMIIVPDKTYYLNNGKELVCDFEEIEKYVMDKTPYAKHIFIKDKLNKDNYYFTDTHWRQETIGDVAEYVADSMEIEIDTDYEVNTLNVPFYGVYYGQSALPYEADVIRYITNNNIDNATVTNYDTGKPKNTTVYNFDKAESKDAYEFFLDGSSALITIENENAKYDKQLIMIRDSFGSSLAPYYIDSYSKIVLVDIRYISPSMLGTFVSFEDSDVLFEFSSLLLNNSYGLKNK